VTVPLTLLPAVGCSTEMPFDEAADFAAGVCASAIKAANDASTIPMKKVFRKFMSAFVFRTGRRVQSHQCSSETRRARSDAPYLQTRSFNCVVPEARAQCTQQKIWPSASTPWPTIRQLQCGQTGASAWIAHSKLFEDVTLSAYDHFKRLVILVFANFAFRHTQFVRARGGSRRCLFVSANGT